MFRYFLPIILLAIFAVFDSILLLNAQKELSDEDLANGFVNKSYDQIILMGDGDLKTKCEKAENLCLKVAKVADPDHFNIFRPKCLFGYDCELYWKIGDGMKIKRMIAYVYASLINNFMEKKNRDKVAALLG